MPQPNFVPVTPRTSRRIQSKGMSSGISTSQSFPLMFNEDDQDATSYRRIPKTQRTTSTVNGTPSSQRMNPFPMMASPFLFN